MSWGIENAREMQPPNNSFSESASGPYHRRPTCHRAEEADFVVPADRTASPSAPRAEPGTNAELAAEAAHLAEARAGLARMRERADSLEAAGGNAVSTEYLAATLHRRRLSLVDDPTTPLFFGRIDIAAAAGAVERFYVGRRHVHDERGDPMVIDWRADISRAFYRASATDPMDLRLRRRFGFVGGTLTAFEDESFDAAEDLESSRILTEEIERPRVGPMRDIVATIQPDQDEIVRAELDQTLCVQGGPGTGKTAVGLHRAAYLLYAHRAKLRSSGVLVVGPNTAFLHYIEQVLPALGEVEVTQLTIDELVARSRARVRAVESPDVQRIKGDARMAELLRRAVWRNAGSVREAVVVPRGSFRMRLYPSHVEQLRDALLARGLRYSAARTVFATMLGSAFTAQVEVRGEAADDRTVAALSRSKPVRDCVDAVLPALDPLAVLFRLFSTPELLAEVADGLLSVEDQNLLLWKEIPRSAGTARWSASDLVLLDEITDLLERTASFGHVVLDEAQDLSPMQCRAVGRRCTTGSATVLGDLAQGTSATASESWTETLAHMGKSDGRVQVLERGYRVPREVVEFAARLLPVAAPGVRAPASIRAASGSLRVKSVQAADVARAVVEACRMALGLPGSVGVVVADDSLPGLMRVLAKSGVAHVALGADDDARLTVVPASLAKGLEFDYVVLVEPTDIAASSHNAGAGGAIDPRVGLRQLYIALTRAVSGLTVIHAKPLPEPLAA
jgi:DNA helicase IV